MTPVLLDALLPECKLLGCLQLKQTLYMVRLCT